MKYYHKNPRTITRDQYENLEQWLHDLGDLGGIVYNLPTDELVGGNQRGRVFDIDESKITITDQYDEPDEQGTVAWGYVEWRGHRYSYRAVAWDEKTCEQANIVANKAGGEWDWDALAGWDFEDLNGWGFDADTLTQWNDNAANLALMLEAEDPEDENYSRKIEAPTYEPRGEKPQVEDLFDDSRTRELVEAIDQAEEVSEEEREFLRIAAQRHTVLNFERIADFYAHSDARVQALMEDSALVIIDFEKAIELGFVELTEKIAEMVRDEYGDD